ncbi:hypothetical protein E2C01_005618 [Portunus trituberculatus]|uniref:Uncharacterized protein n=1 Tax=Portunus trituberculatus TaxID=210409 RepID=A0A5B7CZM0_PORTR|nr:hypothetical protein [Portunus trituberculatus]
MNCTQSPSTQGYRGGGSSSICWVTERRLLGSSSPARCIKDATDQNSSRQCKPERGFDRVPKTRHHYVCFAHRLQSTKPRLYVDVRQQSVAACTDNHDNIILYVYPHETFQIPAVFIATHARNF